jgi:hypothetical protein
MDPYDPAEHGFDTSHMHRRLGIAFEDGKAIQGNSEHPGMVRLWNEFLWKEIDTEFLGNLQDKEAHDFLAYLMDEGGGRFPFARKWWVHMGPELGMMVWEDIDCAGFENTGRWAVLRWIEPKALEWVEANWGAPAPQDPLPSQDEQMDDLLAGLGDT